MKTLYIENALETINVEIDSLLNLKDNIDENFSKACDILINCRGKVILMGIGKSGHIASKIAATLASTGTPAFFVHPSEAGHGDFGMITKDDCTVIVSNSGSTPELISLIPQFRRLNMSLITITSKPKSLLSRVSKVTLDLGLQKEACPYSITPTSSTTASLVMGDAIAISLLKARKFSRDSFSLYHPKGILGKQLTLKVKDLTVKGENLPIASANSSIEEVIIKISSKGLGMCIISNDGKHLEGVFTDGDLRRMFHGENYKPRRKVSELMNKMPKTINYQTSAAEALNEMNKNKITSLVAIDGEKTIKGIIHMHSLVKEGIT